MNDIEATPLVSVIIPVFNTANYLRKCLDSVVRQTYANLEIIVVNDGSTDNSLSIIREYAANDKRIVCIDKPNEGLPATRRAGVEKATGKYIQHLDSDDALAHGAIRMLVDRAEETGADLVAIPFYYVYENGAKREADMLEFDELTPTDYFKAMVRWKCHCNVWANFQRRSLFEEHPITFVADIAYGEDLLLMTQLLSYANKVVRCDVPLVYYYQRSNSICFDNWMKNAHDKRRYTDWIENYLEEKGYGAQLAEEIVLLRVYSIAFRMIVADKTLTREDVAVLWESIKRYPFIKRQLPRRWYKVGKAFRLSHCLGFLYVKYYTWKKKLPR